MLLLPSFIIFFFFNDTATTEIYTLSLHDALPISDPGTVATAHARHGQQLNQLWASLLAEPAPAARAKSVRFRRHRSEEHTSELQSPCNLVCRLLLEKKKKKR